MMGFGLAVNGVVRSERFESAAEAMEAARALRKALGRGYRVAAIDVEIYTDLQRLR